MFKSEAVKAGLFASLGSFFGKLCNVVDISSGRGYGLKGTFFLLMMTCNANVWTSFAKSLQQYDSSVPPTVLSTAVSYLGSAILGGMMFGEIVTIYWWSGAALILLGLGLIASEQQLVIPDCLIEKDQGLRIPAKVDLSSIVK